MNSQVEQSGEVMDPACNSAFIKCCVAQLFTGSAAAPSIGIRSCHSQGSEERHWLCIVLGYQTLNRDGSSKLFGLGKIIHQQLHVCWVTSHVMYYWCDY